jgi:hypothetical protein
MQKKKSKIKLTTSEFAKCWGKPVKTLHVYKHRGTIKVDSKGYVDLDDPVNDRFVKKLQNKGQFDLTKRNDDPVSNKPKTKRNGKQVNANVDSNTFGETGESVELIDYEKKKAELKRIKAQTRNEEIKAAKNEGKLIPIQEAETLFIYAIEGFHNYYQQEIDSILNTITGSVDLSHNRYVELRKDIKNILTQLYNETREQLIDGVENLSEQYSEVRGKGEHK